MIRMAKVLLSKAEKTFIIHGVQDNVRADGRKCEDYRRMELETKLVSNAAGSARLRLANTDILVGVKAEIGEPKPGRPDEGFIEFFVDCSANAAPEFEGRGGEDLATVISATLSRAYSHPRCLDLTTLGIIKGQKCWVIYIDILILECGGNLLDAVSIAVKAALYNTEVPTLRVTSNEQGGADIDVSDDVFDCHRLNASLMPCIVTISKIGFCHVVDATMEEETCTLARLQLGVTSDGTITVMKKDGAGSLDPDSITDMIETGRHVGQSLNTHLMSVLMKEEKERQESGSQHTVGFLR